MKIKKVFSLYIPVLIFIITILSCKKSNTSFNEILESGDLDRIELKRTEIVKNQQEIYNKLKIIDKKIDELNGDKNTTIVETIVLKYEKFDHYVNLQGSVKSNNLINIFPEFSGILKKIYVKSGDNVTKGQRLADIDDGGLKDQLSQLEITLKLTETTYQRQKKLWSQKIGSEIEFLETKALYEAQKKGVEQLKKQLKKTFIRAPFKGTIDKVYAKEGEVVFPGRSNLMLILNLDDMYIESDVPENYLNSISKGKKTIIEFPYINAKLESEIRQSGNFINPNNRTYKIEIDIPKTNLSIKPNLNARVKINDYSNKNAILIDESFISIDGNNQKYVYKIKEEENVTRVEKKFVETGKNDGNRIEVTSGLNESDEIVSEGIRKIVNNSKVIVLKK